MGLKVIPILLTTTFILQGCGRVSESRLNPFNWWASDSTSEEIEAPTQTEQRADRLVQRVIDLNAETHIGGVLLTAKGLSDGLGYYDVILLPRGLSDDGNSLMFELRAKTPTTLRSGSQTMLTGVFLATQELEQARNITVIAAENRRTIRRK